MTASTLSFAAQRDEVARCMRRLYEHGLTTTSGGNLSLRADDRHVLLTASKFDKGTLTGAQVGILTLDGANLTPELTPSIEAGMHLAIYRQRPDVTAVVHAHPVTASAFCCGTVPLDCRLLAESYAIVGDPGYAAYALMGTPELAAIVADTANRHNCVLMANHGVLTVGRSLLEAFDRLEVLETAARLNLITRQLGGAVPLTPERLAAIDSMMGRHPSSG